jgi:hypothetical protein
MIICVCEIFMALVLMNMPLESYYLFVEAMCLSFFSTFYEEHVIRTLLNALLICLTS